MNNELIDLNSCAFRMALANKPLQIPTPFDNSPDSRKDSDEAEWIDLIEGHLLECSIREVGQSDRAH